MVLEHRADVPTVEQILAEIGTDSPTTDLEAHDVSIPVEGPATRVLIETVRRLDKAGIEPRDIGVRTATLDDVFLKLTGQLAREGGTP